MMRCRVAKINMVEGLTHWYVDRGESWCSLICHPLIELPPESPMSESTTHPLAHVRNQSLTGDSAPFLWLPAHRSPCHFDLCCYLLDFI